MLLTEILIGPVLDTLGRRLPTVVSQFLLGIVIVLIPCFTSLFPAYAILRVFLGMTSVIVLDVPLLPDYVQVESMGLAQAITQIVVSLSFMFAGSGLYSLHKIITDQKYIYFGLGSFICCVAMFLNFTIKDVFKA